MFGGRRRREAAAEAAHEAERRALFTQLAQRPAHICPFLGLAYERTGYVEGPSIEHRCFAFGDPAPLSSEQQTRVCQEKGYGQCPRYLRGLLVTPTEELQALRNPRAAMAAAAPPLAPPRAAPVTAPPRPAPPPAPSRPAPVGAPPGPAPDDEPPRRRGRRLIGAALVILLLLWVAAGAAFLLLWRDGAAFGPTEPTATIEPSATVAPPSASPAATVEPSATPAASESELAAPTPEPTPQAGDTFAFYEVAVGPGSNLLFEIDDEGNVGDERRATFDGFSFAPVEPIQGTDGGVYWRTEDGGLAGLAYHAPESGEFRIRAVFTDDDGSRRSVYLDEADLNDFPEATPAP